MKLRKDIQEIRGIAILLVFFYHLSSKYVPGGFIGVDIFFVISGYLISSILSNYNNDNGLLHIINFYGKRIKRLFPSSFICLVCYFYYHPTLSKHSLDETILYYDIFAGLLCFSNIRFYKSTLSYFQNEKSSILLNYWSLSLEEQFYLFLPLFFNIFNTFIFIIISSFSFIYCVIATYGNDSSSYYLLYSRAWELLLGLLTFKSPTLRKINSKLILCIIIFSSYLIGIYSSLKFPGFIAIVPTILTSLLLVQNNSLIFNSATLENMGNMSYVIYLFHYPIIQNNKSLYLIFLKTSIISYLIYYYIEVPIKRFNRTNHIIIFSVLCSLIFIQCISKSINNNKSKYKKLLDSYNCKIKLKCSYVLINNLDGYSVLLIGDSHLAQYIPIISPYLDKYNVGRILFLQVWIINIEKNYISISNLILDMKKLLLCILSLYVDYKFQYAVKSRFEKSFKYLVERILSISDGMIIFQDTPHRISINNTRCERYLLPILKNNRIKYIDIFGEYCKRRNRCIENIYSKIIFKDFHHLSEEFVCKNRLIYDLIKKRIDHVLINNKKNNTVCIILNLQFKNIYNIHIIQNYNIRTIKRNTRRNKFGFAEIPYFS